MTDDNGNGIDWSERSYDAPPHDIERIKAESRKQMFADFIIFVVFPVLVMVVGYGIMTYLFG